MKKRAVCFISALVTLVLTLATPARAQQSFVERYLNRHKFLDRYQPSSMSLPEPAPVSLQGLVRDGALPIGVGDMIELVLKNNLDIVVDRLAPYSSGLLVDAAYRPFEPIAHLGASVARDKSPSRSQLTGSEPVSQLSYNFSAGISQSLASGTVLGVEGSLIRGSSNNIFNTFNPAWTGLLRYSVTQHMLKDHDRTSNMRQIRIARNNEKISEVQFERQVIDLVTQAEKAYWDLVFGVEDLKVKQRSLDLATKTVNDNKRQVAIGTLAPIDVVQAEKELAARNVDFVVSTGQQALNEDQIKKLLSNAPDPGLVLARILPMDAANAPSSEDVLSAEAAVKIALESRPEMRQLDYDMKNRDIDLEYRKNQLLPQLDFVATFNQNGIGGTETLRSGFGPGAPIIAINEGGILNSLGQLASFGYPGFSLGVNFQVPLGRRAEQADFKSAAVEKRTTENRRAATAQQIALEVRNAITAVNTNKARIEAAQKTRELAERTLDAEQRKFDLGASTIRFVLEEQRNLIQAQTNEIAALVNYAKSMVDYRRALGETLKSRNIDIDKTLTASTSSKSGPAGPGAEIKKK